MSIYTLPKSKNLCKEYSSSLIDIEKDTGEILPDKRPNGEERPWRLHKMNSLKLHSLYGKALRVDDSVITENRLQSLEQCGDNLLFSVNDKKEKRLKIYCYVAVCGLLWSNWCEVKYHEGVEFGEYSLRQYRYAKEYYKYVKEELENGL